MGVRVDYQNAKQINDLDYIYITGGGYIDYPFRGISRDSAMGWEEPVWGDLQRSTGSYVLSNIDNVDYGLVARCEISFKYMNYDDLFALRRIAKQRVCTVNYFNRDTGERETQEMAFTGADLEKIYAFDSKYLGALNVSIKLVATNRDKVNIISANHTISYNANGGSGSIASETRRWSEALQLSDGTGFTKTGYSLTGWNTKADGTGWAYLPNQQITVFEDLTLYAQWK